MTSTARLPRYLAVLLLTTGQGVASAGDDSPKGPPPFPLSKQTQQRAYDYLVCATQAFQKKYTGTIELDKAVAYSLGQCTEQKQAAHDSVQKDAVAGGCESCAPEVQAELDREVREKLIADIDYEEKAETAAGGWFD
jgi:hypothetical protein